MTDEAELLNVALKSEHTDTAVAALERIDALDSLAAVAQRARNKVAGRRARTKARQLEEAAQPHTEPAVRMTAEDVQRARLLLHRTESVVAIADPDEAARALADVRLEWAEFGADVDIEAGLVQQFESASEAAREAIGERQQERIAEEERARAIAQEQAERLAIVQEIEELGGEGAPDRIAELKVQWDALPPMPSEYAASLTRRFQDASRAFMEHERHRRIDELHRARRSRGQVGRAVRVLFADRARRAVVIECLAQLRARQRSAMGHERRPLRRPAEIAHQLARQAEREVEAAHPRAGAREQALEIAERFEALDRFQPERGLP